MAEIKLLADLAGLSPYPDSFLRNPGYRWWTVGMPGRCRRPVGFAVFLVMAPEVELLDMAILPWFRRLGLGHALLRHAFRRLRAVGVDTCHLEVRASNQAAIALYRTNGFRVVGTRRRYYRDPAEDALLLTASPL